MIQMFLVAALLRNSISWKRSILVTLSPKCFAHNSAAYTVTDVEWTEKILEMEDDSEFLITGETC